MPAAVAVPLIATAASTGASLIGAKMSSNAAKDAAKIQNQGATQAMGVMRDVYAPYVNAGHGVMGTLGKLTTPGPNERYLGDVPQFPVRSATAAPMAVPRAGGVRSGTMGDLMPRRQPMAMGGGTIRLRAPNGEEGEFPPHLAEQYIARGAMRV